MKNIVDSGVGFGKYLDDGKARNISCGVLKLRIHNGSCWSVVGLGLAVHDQQLSNRHAPTVKPEAPSAVACS